MLLITVFARLHLVVPFRKRGDAPRAARRPAGKARRSRVSGILEEGATPPDGMHRRPNASALANWATRQRTWSCTAWLSCSPASFSSQPGLPRSMPPSSSAARGVGTRARPRPSAHRSARHRVRLRRSAPRPNARRRVRLHRDAPRLNARRRVRLRRDAPRPNARRRVRLHRNARPRPGARRLPSRRTATGMADRPDAPPHDAPPVPRRARDASTVPQPESLGELERSSDARIPPAAAGTPVGNGG